MPTNIPDIPNLTESLQSLRVVESTTRPDGGELLSGDVGREDGGKPFVLPELWLCAQGPLSAKALIGILASQLEAVEHSSTDSVAGLFLALYTVNTPSTARGKGDLERFFGCVVEATAELTFVFPTLSGGAPSAKPASFQLGSFQFEPMDLARLTRLCDQLGCDYARKYSARLAGKQSIRGEPFPNRIVGKTTLRSTTPLAYRVYDDYLAAIASQLTDVVLRSYVEETALFSITHGWIFPLERFLRDGVIESVCIFRETSRKNALGWVVPAMGGVLIKQPPHFWTVAAHLARTWADGRIGAMSPRDDFPEWIRRPAQLVNAAMVHRDAVEWDLAGLVATTAVERMLCSSKADLGKTVRQLGSLVAGQSDPPIAGLNEARVRDLYQARSNFVHEGSQIKEPDARDLVTLAQRLLRVAAQAASRAESPRALLREDWLRTLEAIRTGLESGFPQGIDAQRAAGLLE